MKCLLRMHKVECEITQLAFGSEHELNPVLLCTFSFIRQLLNDNTQVYSKTDYVNIYNTCIH